MSDSFVKPGLEVVLSVGPISGLGISSAKVVSVNEQTITLQTDGRLLFVRTGVLLEIRVPDRNKEGWSQLISLSCDDEKNLMELSLPRWADTSRSHRKPADFRVKVSSVEATADGPKLRQISGHVSNISLTGAKVLLGKELEAGGLYLVEMFLDKSEMPCTAVGRIVRSTAAPGEHKEGCEVGFHFVKFISGLADYAKAVGDAAFSSSIGDIPDFEEEEAAA